MAEPKLNWEIEFRPHIGQMRREGQTVDVEHPQWIVLAGVNGRPPKQVGYVAHGKTNLMPLSLTAERLGKYLFDKLVEAVAEKAATMESPQVEQ